MRRKDKEISSRGDLEEILKSGKVCRIALSDQDTPYVLPMNYAYRDNCLYLHSAPEGRKIDILNKNKRVCFEVSDSIELKEKDTACSFSMKYRSVIGEGEADILTDRNEKKKALNLIMHQISGRGDWEMTEQAVDRVAVIKVPINKITGKASG